jgi:hypothetical protein
MMAATKSMIALGFASAMFFGNPSPTLAANVHARAQASEVTSAHRHHRSGYDDHASSPFGRVMSPDSGYRPGQFVTPDRYGETWDPYGLRWEGGQ